MNKEIIIIGLIVLSIYLYYQQNNQTLTPDSSASEIKRLEKEVQHFQSLYQKKGCKGFRSRPVREN